jgi:hypothetical protein
VIAWIAAAALAGEPQTCTAELQREPDALSVAWVSPLGAHVGSGGWLTVVPTADLHRWVAEERPGVGRFLQRLGLRKSDATPRRGWKVTIFDVSAAELCRPLSAYETPGTVEGVASCDGHDRVEGAYDGCGSLTDRADGSASLPVFRVLWADAARDGFCVLPVERYLAPEGDR